MSENQPTLKDEIDAAIGASDEPDEDTELEVAQPESEGAQFRQPGNVAEYALEFSVPVSVARERAHIPPQVKLADLEGKTFVIAEKIAQKAFLPADGTSRPGYQCLCADVETRKPFTVWIGQVTLKKDLESLPLPIKVTLTKRGRAWIFS